MSITIAFTVICLFCNISHAGKSEPNLSNRQAQVHLTTDSTPVYSYKIINIYPHDGNVYTQGLVFDEGFLYEGTGIWGKSSLRRIELETGKVLKVLRLPDFIFGEGIVVFRNKIFQLTWRSKICFVYDRDSFDLLRQFSYKTEGWGITHDGERLIMSDGSSIIRFRDPETFMELGHIQVRDANGPVEKLNELEYVKGEIYANVWMSDRIVRIDQDTGKVKGWIDLKGLFDRKGPAEPVGVLNGIAYDAENDRLFVTGKLWPVIFEIELGLPLGAWPK